FLVGAAVTLHVDTPGVEALRREIVHGRGDGSPRDLQVEGRLRAHGGAVHEQDGAALLRRRRLLLPQEQADIALVGPMLFAADNVAGRVGLVHRLAPWGLAFRHADAASACRRKTLQWAASTMIATGSPTANCCIGWVCTRSTRPDGSVAWYSLMLP